MPVKDKAWYALVADRAVEILGGLEPTRYTEAWEQMRAETVERDKPGEVRLNRRELMGALGVSTAAGILVHVLAGIDASGLDPASIAFLKSEIDGDGLDLKHTETQGMLASFVISGMPQSEVDQLLALTKETVDVWPGLRNGEVQNALEWRYGGKV